CASAQTGDGAIVTTALYHNNLEVAWRDPVGGILPDGEAAVRLRTCHSDVQTVNVLVWTTGAGVNPSFIYTATVVATDPSGPYDIWEYLAPGPGYNIDQWYQFRIADAGLLGHYHPAGGNTGPGVWVAGPNPVNPSWSLPTIPAPPADYPVPSWLKDAVIYQIFPDRFRNGSASNDIGGVTVYGPTTCNGYPGPGAPACVTELHSSWTDLPRTPGYGIDFFGGDLQGIIAKINEGYFDDLGVNTLYLNPVFNASSNHGYDANDYYNINPRFGDNATFDQFMTAATAHGLRVILDGVFNHAGSDSKYMDGYGLNRWPADIGACEGPNPYRSWFTTGGSGSGCTDGWKWKGWYGYETIPEFVDASADVRAFFYRDGSAQSPGGKSVTRYWLEKGIAGWRFDVAQDITHDWWRDMRPYVKTVYGNSDVLMLGEVTGGCYPYQEFVNAGELDSAMNYCFRDWLRDYANGGSPASFDASWQNFRNLLPPSPWYGMMNLISSHDSPRLLSQLNQDTGRLKLAVMVQMTLPGAPSVYYGDEVSLPGSGDPDNRRPYPWSDRGGSPDTNMYQHFKTLIGIRNQHAALRGGDMTTLLIDATHSLYSYLRWNSSEQIVVITNNSGSAANGVVPVAAHLPDGTVLTDLLNGGTFTVSGGNLSLSVPAQWGRILHVNLASTPTSTPTTTGGPTATPTGGA
ncbi:MAG: alpha-amylase family glycosyl hydrolase, partial [Anaerolineae bacterium]